MGIQNRKPQITEQANSPEELDEMEGSHLSDGEFRVMMCCDPSRPGGSKVFMQTEKYSWNHRDVWHAFIHEWVSHTCCKLHVYLPVSCLGPCSPA